MTSQIISYITEKNSTISLGGLSLKIIDAAVLDAGPHWQKEEHFHTYFEFHIIKSGKGSVSIEGTTLPLQANDFYITGPYVMHEQISDPLFPMVEYCLQCEISLSKEETDFFDSLEDHEILMRTLSTTYPRTFTDDYGSIQLFESIIKETTHKLPGFSLQIQPLLLLLLISLFRSVITTLQHTHLPDPQSDGRAFRMLHFIENNYHLSPTIDDLSKIIFLSPKQINRIMQKHFNCTFNEKLLLCKVNQAKHLFAHSQMSTQEIADACGFSSHYYMYQVFKRFNLPPPTYFRVNNHLFLQK